MYLDSEITRGRTRFLLKIADRFISKNDSILEIGCNVGRNLNALYLNGFRDLSGIEINERAIRILKSLLSRNGRTRDFIQ